MSYFKTKHTKNQNKRLNEISSLIREYRFAVGITQQELSELAELNRNTIVRIENSKNISLLNLLKIAEALDVNLNELFADIE